MKGLSTNKKMIRNIGLIYGYDFLGFFMILIPVIVPFFKSHGLSMEEVYQLQAIFSLGLVVCEVPSGYLSDLWGRKNTLLLAWIFETVGVSVILFADSFAWLVVFELTLAVSCSLRSGTDLSVLYDSLYSAGREGSQSKTLATFFSVTNIAEGLAALMASGILLLGGNIEIILWVYVGTRLVSGVPLFALTEPPRKRMSSLEHKGNFKKIVTFIRRSDDAIWVLFLNSVFWGLATFVIIWAYQHVWSELGIAVAYFGLLWGVLNLSNALVAKLVPRWERAYGRKALLMVMGVAPILGYVGFAVVKVWPVILLAFLFSLTRAINGVVIRDDFNTRLPSEFRATANSLIAFAFRMVFVVIGPLAGFLLDHVGTGAMMMTFAAFFTVVYFTILVPLLGKQTFKLLRES